MRLLYGALARILVNVVNSIVEYATLEWVNWFNNRRLLEPIGNIPPAEAEERYYAMLDECRMAA